MIYVTGDCHGDFKRFSTKNFPDQKTMTRDDVVIICGDFGLWHKCPEEDWWLNWLNRKSFTTVFVDGNHENFDRLYSDEFKIVDFHGAKAHKIRAHIFHIMRGEIFTLEGKRFWCFGGAQSHDISDGILDINDFKSVDEFKETVYLWNRMGKMFRINHLSWWEEELPTQMEMDWGMINLEDHGHEVDYIITHCAPQEVAVMMGYYDYNSICNYFNMIAHTEHFGKWYFGHYHRNETIMGKFVCLYKKIERIE